MNEKEKVKIFVGYHKPNTIYKSEVFQPILTSSVGWDEEGIIRDDSRINIAEKNKNYGELTGHYWVWKNFLPQTDAEYIGFCHYRRFLDFNIFSNEKYAFVPTNEEEFKKRFPSYTEEKIYNVIKDYDIILPHKYSVMGEQIYKQYITHHPKEDLDLALYTLNEIYPQYVDSAIKIMTDTAMYPCLNFIMKKKLLNEYMEWIFNFLSALEQKSDWFKRQDYQTRIPAFLAERFFNVWLLYNMETENLKVLNSSSSLIIDPSYEKTDQDKYIALYSFSKKM